MSEEGDIVEYNGAGAKRARHNSSLLDAHILKSGDDTEDIPDSYVIFITENDVMKGNQSIYLVERYVTIEANKVLKGVAAMCKIMEDMRNEAALDNSKETAKRMIKKGKMSLEEIAEYVPALSLEELKQLEAEVMQMA